VPTDTRIRASDADRDQALTQLREHYAAGRLSAEERQDRAGAALAARTLGDIGELLTDLPDLSPTLAAPPRPPGPVGGPSFRPTRTGGPARARPAGAAAGLAGLGVIAAAYVVTGLLTGIWWIPWALVVIPAVRLILRARHRRPGAGVG
jgi:hypothetical protein